MSCDRSPRSAARRPARSSPTWQLDAKSLAPTALYAPREAVRMRIRAAGGFGRTQLAQYPAAGAQIDYYVETPPGKEMTLQILDGAGAVIRSFTSASAGPAADAPVVVAMDDDEGTGGGARGPRGPIRIDKGAGLHRFTWDLRYPGAWASERNPEGPNGPVAPPGAYKVRLTAGSFTVTQPLTMVEDPRILRDGVTLADLQAQFAHNMRVRDMVSDVNRVVARIRSAQQRMKDATGGDAETLRRVNAIAAAVITPPIRYSKPALQTHITYLYQMTNGADQKIWKDAIDRYQVLQKELDERRRELDRVLGPVT